jgi:TrmH family RNA methyltransferase
MHISKNKIKYFSSLKQKKYRESEQLYSVEGEKIVFELLSSGKIVSYLVALPEWLKKNEKLLHHNIKEILEISDQELTRISSFKNPNKVIAIAPIEKRTYSKNDLQGSLSLILDDIKDPGNFGTIIRLADWFGIQNIFCSPETVELYNPKTIQATMGAFINVNVYYEELPDLLDKFKEMQSFNIYGTFLEGTNIYEAKLSKEGFIVIGNESKGISSKLRPYITHKITIPSCSGKVKPSDSLNAAIATAIVCSEFFRRK